NIGCKRDRFGITNNLNGFLGLIHDHCAIFAMLQMPLKFLLHDGIDISIDIVRQLADDAFAIQFGAPCRKGRFSFSLSLRRARNNLDLTAGTEIPNASAVSCVESSSKSRKRKTMRYSGSSLSITSPTMFCISVCAYLRS